MTAFEDSLVLPGWRRVLSGPARAGDRYWDPRLAAWLPVAPGLRLKAADLAAVIRREGE